MKLSVITVCKNAVETIEQTFLSIYGQTYKNIEHIVIDGESSDGTINVINKYRSNISHFISEPDKGLYEAMNKGIKLATGDFIIFLNANDTFYNEKIIESVSEILNKNPDVKVLFGDVDFVSHDKTSSKITSYENVKDIFYFVNENICHQCIFYHRSLFKEYGGFSQDYKIFADWDFNINTIVEKKVKTIYAPLIISRFQFGGLSSDGWTYGKLYKEENNSLIKKYYPQIFLLVCCKNRMIKTFNTLYKVINKILFIDKTVKLIASNKTFKLNITEADISMFN